MLNRTIRCILCIVLLVFLSACSSTKDVTLSDAKDPANTIAQLTNSTAKTTELGAAIWEGDRAMVETLLSQGKDVNGAQRVEMDGTPPFATIPLIMAVEAVATGKADVTLVKYLLDQGAKPNVRIVRSYRSGQGQAGPPNYETPLASAVSARSVEVFKVLVDAGAKPDVEVGPVDWSPPTDPDLKAVIKGRPTVSFILKNSAPRDPVAAEMLALID